MRLDGGIIQPDRCTSRVSQPHSTMIAQRFSGGMPNALTGRTLGSSKSPGCCCWCQAGVCCHTLDFENDCPVTPTPTPTARHKRIPPPPNLSYEEMVTSNPRKQSTNPNFAFILKKKKSGAGEKEIPWLADYVPPWRERLTRTRTWRWGAPTREW